MQFSEILFSGRIAWIEEFEGRNPNTWNLYSTHWVNSHKSRLVHSEWRKYINLRIGKYFFPSREIFTTHFSCQSLSEQMGKGCGEWFSWNLENCLLMIFSNFCIWSFWFLDKTNHSNYCCTIFVHKEYIGGPNKHTFRLCVSFPKIASCIRSVLLLNRFITEPLMAAYGRFCCIIWVQIEMEPLTICLYLYAK